MKLSSARIVGRALSVALVRWSSCRHSFVFCTLVACWCKHYDLDIRGGGGIPLLEGELPFCTWQHETSKNRFLRIFR